MATSLHGSRTHFIAPTDFPYKTHNDAVVYDYGNFPAALTECLRLLDYDAVRLRQVASREDPSAPLIGIGLSAWLEIAGFGPNGSLEGFGHLASWLIDLCGAGIAGIALDGGSVVVGAMTSYREVARSPIVAAHAPLLARAASLVGDPQVRNRGTIGGAVAHGDPASDVSGP